MCFILKNTPTHSISFLPRFCDFEFDNAQYNVVHELALTLFKGDFSQQMTIAEENNTAEPEVLSARNETR